MNTYRRLLALPKVGPTLLFMFIAGLPLTAVGLTLTLHVVNDFGRSYAEAGFVGAASSLGAAVGSPFVGRLLDRYSLRPVVAACGVLSTVLWCVIPFVPYAFMLALALPATMCSLPIGSLARQFLTSVVPFEQRRSAFTLNTILVEVSFIFGPALCMLAISAFSARVALLAIGVWRALNCVLLYVVNPSTRAAGEAKPKVGRPRLPLRDWFTAPFAGALITAFGALFVLYGTELSLIAALREHGRVELSGMALGGMAGASIVGGLVHGAVRQSWSQARLALLLGALLVPVGLVEHNLWLMLVALIPMNLFCTPTLAANSEAVADLAPAHARGEAMGLQDAATRMGQSLAGPVVGFAIDHGTPATGFVVAGLVGAALAIGGRAIRGDPQSQRRLLHRPRKIGCESPEERP